MKKSRKTILVLWLSCISISTVLSASTICRNALYLAAIISFIDMIVKKIKIEINSGTIIIFSTLFLSLSFYLPTILYPSVELYDIDFHYKEAAKRIFLGAVISYYIILYREKISYLGWLGSYFWIIVGYIYTFFIALKFSDHNERLEIKTISTMTAYVFVLLSLATLYITLKSQEWIRLFLVASVVVSSIYILLLTQTRSVLLTYPILLLISLFKGKFFTKKSCFILSLAVILTIASQLPKFYQATERISNAITEYDNYKNNDNSTSLGSRFSIWKAGLSVISTNLLGESADKRDHLVRNYINIHENGNPEALRVIKHHYHNDLLEAVTLRGIIGLFILIFFFIIAISSSLLFTGNINLTLFLMVPTLIYGSTDSLFIDYRYVTIMVLLIPFYLCSTNLKIGKGKNFY